MTIEQAKGVLAERRRITVDEAFDILLKYARNHNLRLSDLAADVARRSPSVAGLLGDADPTGMPTGTLEHT